MAIDTTGINTNKIEAMKDSIETWAKAVDEANITTASKNITSALKGTQQVDALRKLCQACESYTKTLTKKLRDYESRLDEVKAAYEKNDTSSTSISSVKAAIDNLKS